MRTTAIQSSGIPFQDICTLVGLMTLTWAWVENSLAITIGIVNENLGPIKGHSQPPLSLSKRIDCFKTALRDIASLKSLQQEGGALALRLTQLGRRRHDFIHGAAWQFEQGRFEAVSIAVKSGNYAVQNHRFDQSDALILCNEIASLQDDMAVFMLKVVGVFQN
jgi:hypothetical protein